MKIFTIKMLGLVTLVLLLGACSQMATFENEDLTNSIEKANQTGFNLSPYGTKGNENARMYSATDCTEFCIDPESPEYSVQSAQINNNSGPQTRVFTYSVYNTLTGFELGWSYAATNNAGRKLKITVSGAGFATPKTYTSTQQNGGGGVGSTTFAFDASWAACGVVTVVAEILDGDNVLVSGPNTSTYSLIGECVDCDSESFSYSATVVGNNTANVIFTYDAAESLEDAEVRFTFPQIQNVSVNGYYTAPDEKVYSVNNNGNNTNFTWIGDIGCKDSEGVTFEFEVSTVCNSSGKSQIWTDASVNGISVKNNDTPNIRFWCTTQTIEESND